MKEIRKMLEKLDANDLELLLRKLNRKKHTCPFCGAKLDCPVKGGCGGDPFWHEEGFAEVRVTIEYEN